MAEDIQQALQLVTTNTQLTILPTFSNDPNYGKTFATEWLQMLMKNKQEVGLKGLQKMTHSINVLRGEVLNWCNALPLMDLDKQIWENLKTQFEQDF
jgi:hypothetical protein